jgi:hypothetical protein
MLCRLVTREKSSPPIHFKLSKSPWREADTPLAGPIRIQFLHLCGWIVCEGGHWLDVMKIGGRSDTRRLRFGAPRLEWRDGAHPVVTLPMLIGGALSLGDM